VFVPGLPTWFKELRNRKTLLLLAVLLFVEFVYFAIISVGKFDLKWPIQMLFYDQLADAFRLGQLHLPRGPDPYLIAQKNPYNPAFMRWWNLDATYYHGRYYIYWGPFPAVIQAVGKELLHIKRIIGDQYLVFLFFSLMTMFGAVLIVRMARRLAVGIPPWLIALCALGLGLANPVTYLLASAGVYQAAISGSQAFLFLGIIYAFDAVWEAKHSSRRALMLLGAGIAWSLAIGCRISVVLAVAPIILCTLICTAVTEPLKVRRFVFDGLWVTTPIALTIFTLLYYNKVRFDEWLEFGVRYQLSAFPFRSAASYILPNVESYFLRQPILDCKFPYIFSTLSNGAGPITNWFGLPRGYLLWEPTIGMLYVVPMVYTAPIALVGAWHRARARLFESADSMFAAESRQRRAYVWFVVCMLLAAIGPAFIPVKIYFATMRYLSDFTNALLFLAILGLFAWFGKTSVSQIHRWLRATTAVVLVTVTCVCGVLLGYQGYLPYFKTHNPELHQRLVPALSMCGDR
jgi:hypothetical protein